MKLPFALGVCLLLAAEASAQNFTSGTATARKFGVHEIVLAGNGGVANPFDTSCRVTFTAPSGAAKTVDGFFDGGSTWRARVYVSESGTWRWSSASTDSGLNGRSGTFPAASSPLRGRLLVHPRNPRQWATEDGRWFLNLNDTAYHLFSPYDREKKAIPDADFQNYVKDCAAKGITSLRSWAVFASDGTGGFASSNGVWKKAYFSDTGYTKLQTANFGRTDGRLKWMLNNHPDVYVQLILLPSNDYGKDDSFWAGLSGAQRQRVLKHLVARYAAFPQMFWLVVNDTHYGTGFPNNDALAREVGNWFRTNDPWKHPMATGPNRDRAYPFPSESWSTYIHIEDQHDLGAGEYAKYHAYAKPVFLGEDRYEQDHGTSRDPIHMRYWQRRLFWAWLLSGGSTNYGGRWWVLHPYAQTGSRTCTSRFNSTVFSKQLVGLDSVPPIRNYFGARSIELSDFQAEHALVQDLDGRTGVKAPKLMRRGTSEYLIYHPHAASDGQSANVDGTRAARMRVNLSSAVGTFQVQWMRAHDGVTASGTAVSGGGARDFTAPWTGHDVVLWLKATTAANAAPSVAITQPASGASYTPPATVTVAATASDSDGSVIKVEFFSGTTLLGSDTTSPYGFTWTAVPAGTYSLTARATDNQGATRTSAAVSITVAAPSGTVPALAGLTLINADADTSLGALVDGATINLAALPTRSLSVRADPANSAVESVRFEYDGDPAYKIESQAPFAIAGDNPTGNYNPWTPALGAHSLRVTPYAADGATGAAGSPITVRFTVVDDPSGSSGVAAAPPAGDPGTPGDPSAGTTASAADDDRSGGGNCGLLGAELLLLLLGAVKLMRSF